MFYSPFFYNMKVLYIHHCGIFGGASKSLLELIRAFPHGKVSPVIITPKGSVAPIFSDLPNSRVITVSGVSIFDHTRIGHYRYHRWAILLREIFYFPGTVMALLKVKKHIKDIDIIHLNDICYLSVLLLVKWIWKKPVIMHARAVQETKKGQLRRKSYKFCLKKYVDQVIAIDQNVYNSLPYTDNAVVIHNGMSVSNENNPSCHEEIPQFSKQRPLKILFIGNLLKHKGILELIGAAKRCQDANLNVEFTVVGPTDYSKSFRSSVLSLLGLQTNVTKEVFQRIETNQIKNVKFVGFQERIIPYIENTDVICFPSYFNAVGRPVIEGALLHRPSIVALDQPIDDTFVNKKTGLACKAKNVDDLLRGIVFFYENPHQIQTMGECAYQLAKQNFDIRKNAQKILDIYQQYS